MVDVRHERVVHVPVSAAWTILADFGRIADWSVDVDHSSFMTARTEGVGAIRRVQIGAMVLLERVVEWEPEARLAYEIDGLPPVVAKVVNTWSLDATPVGTRVALTASVTPGPRPPMRVAARAVARRLGATNARLLDELAAAAVGASR